MVLSEAGTMTTGPVIASSLVEYRHDESVLGEHDESVLGEYVSWDNRRQPKWPGALVFRELSRDKASGLAYDERAAPQSWQATPAFSSEVFQ